MTDTTTGTGGIGSTSDRKMWTRYTEAALFSLFNIDLIKKTNDYTDDTDLLHIKLYHWYSIHDLAVWTSTLGNRKEIVKILNMFYC